MAEVQQAAPQAVLTLDPNARTAVVLHYYHGLPAPTAAAQSGQTVEVGFVDQGYTGEEATCAAAVHAIDLQMTKKPAGETGFVLLPKRWVVERSFAWLSRSRRLGRGYDRLSSSLPQLHFVVFACIMLARHAESS